MKVLTVVGARPQFIKAAVVSRAIRNQPNGDPAPSIREVIVHTGQHYDHNMSQVFFDELDIPRPDHNLEVGSGTHGVQTGEMLMRLEKVMQEEKPDWVLVYGDTNSTLAGALAATKLHLPVAHVEAGLRSFNRRMPEEINRVMTDHVSTLLCCPTQTAVDNLREEGLPSPRLPRLKVEFTGDVMYDAALYYANKIGGRDTLKRLGLESKRFILATIHRAENTDDLDRLREILHTLDRVGREIAPVVWPIHPRTRNRMDRTPDLRHWLGASRGHFRLVEPFGYLDMVAAEMGARLILTDSGGVQKEAYFHRVTCLVLRTETEWVELVRAGWNAIVGHDWETLLDQARRFWSLDSGSFAHPTFFGEGSAGPAIVRQLRTSACAA